MATLIKNAWINNKGYGPGFGNASDVPDNVAVLIDSDAWADDSDGETQPLPVKPITEDTPPPTVSDDAPVTEDPNPEPQVEGEYSVPAEPVKAEAPAASKAKSKSTK